MNINFCIFNHKASFSFQKIRTSAAVEGVQTVSPSLLDIQNRSDKAVSTLVGKSCHGNQLLNALDIEEKGTKRFVGYKYFLNVALSQYSYPWSQSPETRRKLLSEAIALGEIEVYKIPNPFKPYPTTAIRLKQPKK